MQKHLYIPLEYNIVAIKLEVFIDMSKELKSWRHKFNNSLKIRLDNTLGTVKARVGEPLLFTYNSTDVDILLEKQCSEENKVSYKLCWVLFSFIKTNVLC
jgi:hypothetical protein